MYNAFKVFTATLASGATSTTPLDLGGHAWDRIFVQAPTHTSGGTHYIRTGASLDEADMYQVYIPNQTDGTHEVVQFLAPNGIMMEIPGGLGFITIENTTGIANGAIYKICCS